jgi:hypothetical protein
VPDRHCPGCGKKTPPRPGDDLWAAFEDARERRREAGDAFTAAAHANSGTDVAGAEYFGAVKAQEAAWQAVKAAGLLTAEE